MSNKKLMIHLFTIADYEEEEVWLRRKHQDGWKLVNMYIPCFYVFEKCAPEDVVYRLDYKNNTENNDYFQLVQDYGWEYFARCVGWLYFRKPVSEADTEQDTEIFSDDISRIDMVNHIVKTRMLPLLAIFFCCIIPNLMNNIGLSNGFTLFFLIIFLLYLYLLLHCGLKLRRLRKKYGGM